MQRQHRQYILVYNHNHLGHSHSSYHRSYSYKADNVAARVAEQGLPMDQRRFVAVHVPLCFFCLPFPNTATFDMSGDLDPWCFGQGATSLCQTLGCRLRLAKPWAKSSVATQEAVTEWFLAQDFSNVPAIGKAHPAKFVRRVVALWCRTWCTNT